MSERAERCYAGFVDFADFCLGCQAGEAPYSRGVKAVLRE